MTNLSSAARRATSEEETAIDFFIKHQRLPALGDAKPPWDFRAWLLPYVGFIHEAGACGNRWGYLNATLDAGRLLDDPIPKVSFAEPDSGVERSLDDWTRTIGFDVGGWHDFARLIDWLAWGLGVGPRPDPLKDSTAEALYRKVDVGPLLATPYDYLGNWIAVRKAPGWNPTAFYPTPHPVCECMTEVVFSDLLGEYQKSPGPGTDPRTKTVCDPCVGTGRMLLHAANHSLRLYGQDIDYLVLTCCKINLALYAPWGVFPLPDKFFGGRRPEGAGLSTLSRPGDLLIASLYLKQLKEKKDVVAG